MAVDTWKGAQPYKYSVFSIWSDDDDDDLHFYTIIFQATCKVVQSHEQKKENYKLCKQDLNLKIENDVYYHFLVKTKLVWLYKVSSRSKTGTWVMLKGHIPQRVTIWATFKDVFRQLVGESSIIAFVKKLEDV